MPNIVIFKYFLSIECLEVTTGDGSTLLDDTQSFRDSVWQM